MLWAVLCLVPIAAGADPFDDAEGRVIREIRIDGLSRVSEARVRANLASREGEPFRRVTAALDRRQLDALRWFSRITLRPELDGEAVVLHVEVAETFRYLVAPAIGITDLDGATLGASGRMLNVGSQGAMLGLTARFGGATTVVGEYERNTLTPSSWPLSAMLTYRDASNQLFDFDEQSLEFTSRAGRNLTRRARAGVSAGYLMMDAQEIDDVEHAETRDHVPQIGAWLLYDSYDSQTTPTRGWRLEGELARLFGDAASWSTTFDVRTYLPLAPRHLLSLDGLAGLRTGEVGSDLPFYLEYGLGGANTVRGWPLGARTGRNQLIGTAEYQYALVPPRAFTVKGFNFYTGVHLAAFVDTGLAWTEPGELSTRNAIRGYGVGVRLFVPFIDLLRVDIAGGESGGGVSVGFGVDFKANRQRERVR